jgi:outer membrane lipoprotein-sorting protein
MKDKRAGRVARAIVVLFVLSSGFLFAGEKENGPLPEDEKGQAFSSLAKSASGIRTISSDFIQERQTSMLREPLIATGRFFFEKPKRLRWEFLKPSRFGFSINGETARRWKDDPGRWQRFDIGKEPAIKALTEQIFAWAGGDVPWLEKRYEIVIRSREPLVLSLTPRSSEEKKYIRHLAVSFSPDFAYVDSVEIGDKEGDVTRIRFVNVTINPALPEDLF